MSKPEQVDKAPKTFDVPRGIPVKLLRLHRAMQVPGKQADDVVAAGVMPNGRSWEIEFIPQMRHHKITFTDPGRQKDGPEVGYVHETNVLTWWPAAL